MLRFTIGLLVGPVAGILPVYSGHDWNRRIEFAGFMAEILRLPGNLSAHADLPIVAAPYAA